LVADIDIDLVEDHVLLKLAPDGRAMLFEVDAALEDIAAEADEPLDLFVRHAAPAAVGAKGLEVPLVAICITECSVCWVKLGHQR
jgi:hypothetical protein